MPPLWLTALAWFSLGIAFLAAGLILYDIYGRGFRQKMWIMEIIWPVTASYFGLFALWGTGAGAVQRRKNGRRCGDILLS